MGFSHFERACAVVAALILTVSIDNGLAYSSYRNKIPNGGETIDGATGIGHISSSGGGARNQFGLDFAGKSRTWTSSLCCLDSE